MPINWSKHQVQLNSAGRLRCGPEWRLTPEFSSRLRDFDLWFVWAGSGEMQTLRGPVVLRPGVCIWMRPNSRTATGSRAFKKMISQTALKLFAQPLS